MPACAQAPEKIGAGSPRCGRVQLRAHGVPFTVNVAGVAKATFPGNENVDVAGLSTSSDIRLTWEDAVFYGKHWLLGPIFITLPKGGAAGFAAAAGSIRSQSTSALFPALNRNEFPFQIHLPRLGSRFSSDQPVINEAVITEIPPLRTEYHLVTPVRYRQTQASTSIFSPITGDVVLEECAVKLLELRDIHVTVGIIERSAENITFEAELQNETPENKITVTWLVWPRSGLEPEEAIGSVNLARRSVRFRFAASLETLSDERWLAIALARPFKSNASAAAKLVV